VPRTACVSFELSDKEGSNGNATQKVWFDFGAIIVLRLAKVKELRTAVVRAYP
jgi:hypothetical protein